jgi:hypothetical protein
MYFCCMKSSERKEKEKIVKSVIAYLNLTKESILKHGSLSDTAKNLLTSNAQQ